MCRCVVIQMNLIICIQGKHTIYDHLMEHYRKVKQSYLSFFFCAHHSRLCQGLDIRKLLFVNDVFLLNVNHILILGI